MPKQVEQQPDSLTGTENQEAEASQETTAEPQSMLEAIENGVNESSEQQEDAEQQDEPKTEQDAKAQETAEPKAEPKPEADAKPENELYKMPEGLKQESQQRFQKLIESNKELTGKLEGLNDTVRQFQQVVTESQATPEEFLQLVNYSKMVKSGDLEGALKILDDQRRNIALALGRPISGVDALSDFPDLKQAVENYELSEDRAHEIAKARTMERRIAEEQTRRAPAMEFENAKMAAVDQIRQMGNKWAASDLDYARKEAVLLQQLPNIAKQFHPSLWAQQVQILYETISAATPAATAQPETPAPLRPSGQRAGSKEPSTMLEAISQGIGY